MTDTNEELAPCAEVMDTNEELAPCAEVIDTNQELALLAEAGAWERLESRAGLVTSGHPEEAIGWRFLGKALVQQGKWDRALAAFAELFGLAPGDVCGYHDAGYACYRLGREEEAEAFYRRALACDPRSAQTHNSLGALLADTGRGAEAAGHFHQSLLIDPNSGFALYCLGSLMERAGGMDEAAIQCLERALALDPHDANVCTALGNLLLRNGEAGKSMELFRRSRERSPLTTWRARKEEPDFSVLLLYAPGSGCTPISYLVRKAPYDCHFYCVLPFESEHLELLKSKADVVLNMIADADYDEEILPYAADLVQALGRPVVNHPSLVGLSDRDSMARRLAGIALCRIPRTVRLAGVALSDALRDQGVAGFHAPFLLRVAGNHGGEEFDRFDDWNAVAEFVARRPEAEYYLSEYLEYRSEDGCYRKYRLISVGGKLFPYHLAIHDHWKVHHFRTDMAQQAWMRAEEERFLRDPFSVFDEPHQEALRAVAAASGLDYCGIDCSLDRDGDIVVFETNAAMLVHDEKDQTFAYKNPFIAEIKDAFEAMLTRLAGG